MAVRDSHFELEHAAPPLVMVEGAVDTVSWEAFVRWYIHYRDKIICKEVQENEDNEHKPE